MRISDCSSDVCSSDLDGNSRFCANYRYGYFPSLSARWRVSGERFMESLPFVNEFSFRASYGHSGKAPNRDYLFYSNINSSSPTYLGEAGPFPANMAYRHLKFERDRKNVV